MFTRPKLHRNECRSVDAAQLPSYSDKAAFAGLGTEPESDAAAVDAGLRAGQSRRSRIALRSRVPRSSRGEPPDVQLTVRCYCQGDNMLDIASALFATCAQTLRTLTPIATAPW